VVIAFSTQTNNRKGHEGTQRKTEQLSEQPRSRLKAAVSQEELESVAECMDVRAPETAHLFCGTQRFRPDASPQRDLQWSPPTASREKYKEC
jgi:hypothetical protein